MLKVLLIIPGFGESPTDAPYQRLKALCSERYRVVTFTPHWKYRVASDWLIEFYDMLKKIDTNNTTVVCFSLGAYITLLAAEQVSFRKVIFCSISPFFREQLASAPDAAKQYFGKRRVTDFGKHRLPKQLKTRQTVFLFGSLEWPHAIVESERLALLYRAKHELVQNAEHELSDEYLREIVKHLQ